MEENFDSFPNNLGEMMGHIPRSGFIFDYGRFEVWKDGINIYSDFSTGQIVASIIENELNVTIDDKKIQSHIKRNFSFGEISTSGNRVMWSKDIFNSTDKIEKFNPDISSLFFKNGTLKKVTYTIHDPNTLVEFYSF